MRGPIDERVERKAARKRRSGVAKIKFPRGKALARIEYFETQRGVPKTLFASGRVFSGSAPIPHISKKTPKRARSSATAKNYAKASKAKEKLIPKFAASTNLPVWRSLGPNFIPKGQTYGKGGNNKPPVSGRCVGIVISPTNPKHLALCTAGGGIWGTLDQGATWHALTDQQPVLSMGAIAAAPGSPNIVYAGTGEADSQSQLGVGLLRSSDGGQTWEHVPSDDLSGVGVYDIAVDPADALHVWVGTTERLLESKDGGATWRTAQATTTWDISINPKSPKEIFVATAAGLIRSANGGSTWTKVALPGVTAATEFERMEVCHAPSNPAIVYASAVYNNHPALWRRATDSGAFASEQSPPMKVDEDIRQAWYDFCFAVAPANPNVVYWGAVYLYKGTRTANGLTWEEISARKIGDSIHADQHHLAFDPSDPNVLYVCNDGGIFRSPNGGVNWKSLNPGLAISEFEFIVHLESQDGWLIGGTQDNGTLGNPAVLTWDQIAVGDGGDCGADNVRGLCYHSYFDMWIERAPALGPKAFKWSDVSPPSPDDYDALFYPPMDVNGRVVAKAGVTIWISEDSGETWEEADFDGGGEKAAAVVIFDATTIFIGTEAGRIRRLKRGTGGWTHAKMTALTSPVNGFISDIVIPGRPDKTIWASCSSFGVPHVFRSLNGGKNWADRTGNLPDIPVNAIVVDSMDTDVIYAATDNGVYRTLNAGTKWADFSNGLPNAIVGDMILHERLRLLRVGTRNRGAWEVKI